MSDDLSTYREYFYQATVIQLRYSPCNHFSDAGWYWEVFKASERLADNSKQYPEPTIDNALFYAKQAVDISLDIETDEQPILIISC